MELVDQQADPLPQLETALAHRVLAVTPLTGCCRDERGQDADEGRLPRPVWTQKTDDLAGSKGQRNLGEGPAPAEVPRHVGQPDGIEIHHAAMPAVLPGPGPRASESSAP